MDAVYESKSMNSHKVYITLMYPSVYLCAHIRLSSAGEWALKQVHVMRRMCRLLSVLNECDEQIYVGCVVVGWGFTSWHHRSSYQTGHRFMAVHTHANFIAVPYSETRPLAS